MSESTSRRAAPQRHLGLTGGIGAGKSTVATMLVELGAHLIDADRISRDLMGPGSPVLAEVVEAFGPEILTEDGELDRPALARKVFGDDAARERLNGIVHPAVRREAQIQREAALAAGTEGAGGEHGVVVVEDIPLLAETGQAGRFDGVIVVEAAPKVRLERLVTARGMDREDVEARLRAQTSDEQRRAIATWVVDNSGDLEVTREQVRKIWTELG